VPAAGQVLVGGLDLAQASPAERDDYRRRLVGYVAQERERGLWPSLTVAENVQAPALLDRGHRRESRRWAGELLEALGLGGRSGHLPAQLAGGERLRLALAVALANRPALLLVDEPAGEVDADTVWAVLTELDALVRGLGTATLIASWNEDVAPDVNRVVWLPGASPAPRPSAAVGRA
jgi:predicted ABC-type transport system involved in lysophospholipase L1 biosynthesis ATPase subunit